MADEKQDLLALAQELTRRVLDNPREKGRIIKEFHAEQVAAHNREGADFALNIYSIHLARDEDPPRNAPFPPETPKTVPWRKVSFIGGSILLVGVIIYTLIGRGNAAAERGPHPPFWSKLPLSGRNNVWYDNRNPTTVVVFVHGIFSDSRSCWLYQDSKDTMKAQYWPELVTIDKRLEQPAIFLGGYATSIDSGPYDARQAAGELRDGMKREGVLERPRIIFVAHSTGGIVVRFLLLHNQDLFRGKMIGLALYASPSIGSPLANELSFLAKFYGNSLGEQLKRENTFLTELDKDFRDLLYNPNSEPDNLRIVGAEGVENFFIVHRRFWPDDKKVVPEDSASHYFGAPVYLRGTDHFSTVKPDTIDHPGHQLLLTFYQKFKKDFGILRITTSALPVFTTVYEDHNAAGQPYVDVQLFEKNDHYTQPPRPAGDNGHELAVQLAAPGPITNVAFRADGVAAGWTHETATRITGTTAQWIGWSNSGDAARLVFTISYKVARQVCTANCQ